MIHTLRDVQVILDEDIAGLYGVETKRLNQQVKRNIDRFESDFMFKLTSEEFSILRSQNVTTSERIHQISRPLPNLGQSGISHRRVPQRPGQEMVCGVPDVRNRP